MTKVVDIPKMKLSTHFHTCTLGIYMHINIQVKADCITCKIETDSRTPKSRIYSSTFCTHVQVAQGLSRCYKELYEAVMDKRSGYKEPSTILLHSASQIESLLASSAWDKAHRNITVKGVELFVHIFQTSLLHRMFVLYSSILQYDAKIGLAQEATRSHVQRGHRTVDSATHAAIWPPTQA